MFFCPFCNGPFIAIGRLQVTLPVLRLCRIGLVMTCTGCAAVSEVDPDTGSLHEFTTWKLAHLITPDNGREMPRSSRSLVYSPLRGRIES